MVCSTLAGEQSSTPQTQPARTDAQRAALVKAQDLEYRQALHDDQARVREHEGVEDSTSSEVDENAMRAARLRRFGGSPDRDGPSLD